MSRYFIIIFIFFFYESNEWKRVKTFQDPTFIFDAGVQFLNTFEIISSWLYVVWHTNVSNVMNDECAIVYKRLELTLVTFGTIYFSETKVCYGCICLISIKLKTFDFCEFRLRNERASDWKSDRYFLFFNKGKRNCDVREQPRNRKLLSKILTKKLLLFDRLTVKPRRRSFSFGRWERVELHLIVKIRFFFYNFQHFEITD